MKVNLIAFQDKAVKELRVDIADALDSYVGYETIDAKLIRPEAVCVMQMK